MRSKNEAILKFKDGVPHQRIGGVRQTANGLLAMRSGGLSVATWVIWGLGSVLLVLLGVGLHLLIAMWRRRDGGSGPQPRPPVAA